MIKKANILFNVNNTGDTHLVAISPAGKIRDITAGFISRVLIFIDLNLFSIVGSDLSHYISRSKLFRYLISPDTSERKQNKAQNKKFFHVFHVIMYNNPTIQ